MMKVPLQMFLLCAYVPYLEKFFKSFFIDFNSCNCLFNFTQDHVEVLIKGLKMHINYLKNISKWFSNADKLTYLLLKGQCHKDFAVLGQFWAKIITLRLYSETKCFCKATTKISNEFYQRGLTIINFLRFFWRCRIKIWTKWPVIFKLQSISILAVRGARRQETVSVPSNSLK